VVNASAALGERTRHVMPSCGLRGALASIDTGRGNIVQRQRGRAYAAVFAGLAWTAGRSQHFCGQPAGALSGASPEGFIAPGRGSRMCGAAWAWAASFPTRPDAENVGATCILLATRLLRGMYTATGVYCRRHLHRTNAGVQPGTLSWSHAGIIFCWPHLSLPTVARTERWLPGRGRQTAPLGLDNRRVAACISPISHGSFSMTSVPSCFQPR